MTQHLTRRCVAALVAGVTATAGCVFAAPADAAAKRRIWATWDRVAHCESSGKWHIDTGNGFTGGLQFSGGTWRAYGGNRYAANASRASRLEQIAVARRVLAAQGPGAWPVCGPRAGLTRHTGHATSRSLPHDVTAPKAVTRPHAHFARVAG